MTALLLALVAEQSSRGPTALLGVLVYLLAAGFGLEFVCSSWPRGAGPRVTSGHLDASRR
ncbi:MAG: hypothetical protein M3131_04440 [Actinomycetota bacterium]|nr:hypothetical protein [Actinomycetota bacterium]